MIVTNENENKQLGYEKNNRKVLTNGGVCLFFKNVFVSNGESKLPTIKSKLRKILVDYGLCQTYLEIDQKLDFIKVYYRDEQVTELKGLLLQRFNQNKNSQAIEPIINIEGSLVIPPDKEGQIKNYPGLTKLLFQEFISTSTSISLIDGNPYNDIKTIIQKGNLAPSEPLQAILAEGVG